MESASATSFADPALPYCIGTAFFTGFIRNWVCLALDAHSHYSHAIFNALQQFSLLCNKIALCESVV
jgi:hypothetical protein